MHSRELILMRGSGLIFRTAWSGATMWHAWHVARPSSGVLAIETNPPLRPRPIVWQSRHSGSSCRPVFLIDSYDRAWAVVLHCLYSGGWHLPQASVAA